MQSKEMIFAMAGTCVTFCSNKVRTIEACVQKVQETVSMAGNDEDTKAVSKYLSHQIATICLNRGDADAVALALLPLENAELARGCVAAAVDLHARGLDSSINVRAYFDSYESRFAEDFDYMTNKLRWLNMHPNYVKSVDEAESLMTALNALIMENMQNLETK